MPRFGKHSGAGTEMSLGLFSIPRHSRGVPGRGSHKRIHLNYHQLWKGRFGVTIPGGIHRTPGLGDKVVIAHRLDSMILEIFSTLNDSVALDF